ncbi:LysR family transcriptional regulator [Actinomadura fibrosa]|uniref:LysR substrate-binding domain-containing protein n=1 Tax=Actinomadura fibrosa TaxID=111802 RepID=UPI001A9553B0|nr:LysR family transcriptional regulator [Actinomadura fibrosa]
MDIRLLRAFLAVAEHGTFGRAAAASSVTQPALTKQIQALEARAGGRLLHRGRHGAALTELGAALLPEARDLVRRADALARRMDRLARGEIGRLAVGFGMSSIELAPRAVAEFRRRRPDADVTLDDMSTRVQVERLEAGELDVGFVRLPVDERWGRLALRTDRLALAVPLPPPPGGTTPGSGSADLPPGSGSADLPPGSGSADLPPGSGSAGLPSGPGAPDLPARAGSVDLPAGPGASGAVGVDGLPDGVRARPFVRLARAKGPGLAEQVERFRAAAGITGPVVQEAHDLQTVLALVAAGVGCALVPAGARPITPPQARLLPIAHPAAEWRVGVIWDRRSPGPLVRAFLGVVRELEPARDPRRPLPN